MVSDPMCLLTLTVLFPDIDSDVLNQDGNTAFLMHIAPFGDRNCTQLLLQIPNIDLSISNYEGKNVIALACVESNQAILKQLLRSSSAL